MENLKLKAEKREKVGGLSSKTAVYKENKIPGIIYGGKDEPLPILVNEPAFVGVKSLTFAGKFLPLTVISFPKGRIFLIYPS